MSSSPQQARPTPENARHASALDELIDMGMDLARLIHAQARTQAHAQASPAPPDATAPAEPAPTPTPDPTIAFDRIARCVRRTIRLAEHIAAARPAPTIPVAAHVAARKQVIRRVENVIARNRHGDAAQALHRELLDRLDTPDLDEDLAHRPTRDVIDDIIADLGLLDGIGGPGFKRRTPQDIATLRAHAHRTPIP